MISRKCVSLSVAAMVMCAMCVFVTGTRAADNGNASEGNASAGNENGAISQQDQKFVNRAWNINTAEIDLGNLAKDKASNSDVKDFAQKMVDDHTKLNSELSDLVQSQKGNLPTQLNQMNQKMKDRLSKLSGSDFDKAYMNAMVKGHHAAVMSFEKESKDPAQTAVDKWAAKTVPTLKEHLQMAIKTGKTVGAPAANEAQAVTAGETEQGNQQQNNNGNEQGQQNQQNNEQNQGNEQNQQK